MKNQPLDPRQPLPAAPEPEELGYADDAIIARAFRWSLAMFILLLVGALGAWYFLRRPPAAAPAKMSVLISPIKSTGAAAQHIPDTLFKDITRESGIKFVHCNGATGEKLLPETMGGGVAFFDFDLDGHQDLLFINSTFWPWDTSHPGSVQPTMALYRNSGQGRFEDVTLGSGLDFSFYGMGVAIGDYDNDDLPDVFISGLGGGRLFHNDGGGKFVEVTAPAGVGGSPQDWSTACAWLDYDLDGRLDLFVANYIQWSREIDTEVGYKLVGLGRAYGQPFNFEGAFPRLYHNEGHGRFKEVTAEAGLLIRNPATAVPMAKTLGVAPVDLDEDGWIDLVLANDTVQNFVFHNQRNGTFKEIGALTGIAFDSNGLTRGAMGIDAARYRDDGSLGIVIGNFANEMNALYVSQNQPLLFVDEAIAEGVGPPSRLFLKFGIFFFDYDLDSRLDLLSVNGHIEDEIQKIQSSQTYAQPAQLFWNCGASSGASFIPVPPKKGGPDLFQPIVGRGSAYADIDQDGDLDVVFTQIGGPPLLLRNEQQVGHHWIRLKLIGTRSNRDAIGALVRIRLADRVISRHVMPTRGYLSQSELPITIGLGQSRHIEEVEVIWPGGLRQVVPTLPIDRTTALRQE